jgi:hypothetical protein
MRVSALTSQHTGRWKSFLGNQEEVKIQHTLPFKKTIEASYRNIKPFYQFCEDKEGDIRTIFPAFKMKSWLFGTEVVSQPFVDNGGFLGDISQNTIAAWTDTLGKTPTEVRLSTFVDNYGDMEALLQEYGFEKHVPRHQFIKELVDPEEMYDEFSSNTTRMIEEGKENGLEVRDIDGEKELRRFYRIFKSAMKHFGTPQHSFSYFQNIWTYMYPDHVKGMNCYFEDEMIGSMICFLAGNYCYFIYNVSDPEYLKKRPNDFLYWKMLQWAWQEGYDYFDFGQVQADAEEGTHAEGLYNFKEKWKPTLYDKPIFLYNKELVEEERERAKRYWRKAPTMLTELAGPLLVSRIGY